MRSDGGRDCDHLRSDGGRDSDHLRSDGGRESDHLRTNRGRGERLSGAQMRHKFGNGVNGGDKTVKVS